jgi:uncharacterized protein (TIGR03000 family)
MTAKWFKKAWAPTFLLAALAAAGASALARAGESPTPGGPKAQSPVEITVRVPAGAQVWFDGEPTAQTGATRAFVSPPLEPGRDYSYTLRVRWTEGETAVERTRRLTFRAGEAITLDFSGRGTLELRGYSDASPDPVPAPTRRFVPPFVPSFDRSRSPANVRSFSDQSPLKGAGPPGSNHPMSFGVGNG